MLGKHWKNLLVSLLGKNKSLLPEWWARWEMVENISGRFLRLVTILLHENPSNESNYNSLTTNQSPMHCWLHFAMCLYTAVILSKDILLELLSFSISSMAPRDAPCQVKIRNMCFFSALGFKEPWVFQSQVLTSKLGFPTVWTVL